MVNTDSDLDPGTQKLKICNTQVFQIDILFYIYCFIDPETLQIEHIGI